MSKHAAFGAKLQFLNEEETYSDIAGVRDISGPGLSADVIDVTTHDSADAFREKIKGLIDAGEVSFDLVWNPEDVEGDDSTGGQAYLLAEMQTRTVKGYRIIFATPSAPAWSFSAMVTGFEPSDPVEGEISASVTLAITGKPDFDAGDAEDSSA